MNRLLLTRSISVSVLICAMCQVVQADTSSTDDGRFTIMAGAFLPAFDTNVKIDSSGQIGDKIDLDNDLGVDQDDSGFWSGFEWRIAERHRLGATYSRFTQTGHRAIDRQIAIGDEIYPVNATVDTTHRIEMIPITYSYSFLKRENDEVAVTVGVHWDRVSLKLAGSTSLSDDDLTAETSADADLPLPLIGLRYDHQFAGKWSAGAGASFFSLKFGEDQLDLKGSLVNARAYTEYRLASRFGAGVAIDYFRLRIKADKSNWDGEYNYDYWGPQFYLTMHF
ncbi:MAG: hypothetical protein R3F24_02735 [Gammaproteobacteria bacterium]